MKYGLASCYNPLTKTADREAKAKAEDKERYMKVRKASGELFLFFGC